MSFRASRRRELGTFSQVVRYGKPVAHYGAGQCDQRVLPVGVLLLGDFQIDVIVNGKAAMNVVVLPASVAVD